MKEAVTKFDLESAFKALDEIEIPVADKVRANRPALTEIFSRKTKFDALMEEYYDISSNAELEDAQEAREAEVAKAKLARIEKIVDLDADSPEDLLTSYVGKYIIQCPQCMTLFYKNQEDVVEDENDSNTVNVSEVCQHCGNESGYTLIGKVGEADEGEFVPEEPELTDEAAPEEEATEEENTEEIPEEDLGDLEELDLNLEDEEEEKKEESFMAHEGEALVEELADDPNLDDKLDAHNEYIEYLRAAISQEEEKLESATNEQVKVAIQRNIDAFKADLENALPDAVKNDAAIAEETTNEEPESTPEEETEKQEESYEAQEEGETLTEALHEEKDLDVSADEFEELINSPEFKKPISDSAVRAMLNAENKEEEDKQDKTEAINARKSIGKLNEEAEEGTEASDGFIIARSDNKYLSVWNDTQIAFDSNKNKAIISSDEENVKKVCDWLKKFYNEFSSKSYMFKIMPVKSNEAEEKETANEDFHRVLNGLEEIQESTLESLISSSLVEAYGNVAGFRLAECAYADNKFTVDGTIYFTSGKTRKTTYTFNESCEAPEGKIGLRGLNEKLGADKKFTLVGYADKNKTLITESFKVTKE